MKPILEIARQLISLLAAKGLRLGAAESCSGGRLAAAVTSIPGASAVFAGSLVAYQDSIKSRLLGVSRELLESGHSVSALCAQQMALGCLDLLEVDLSIAITGSCGPTCNDPSSKVGEIWIALADRRKDPTSAECRTVHLQLEGSRDGITDQAVWHSLQILASSLEVN
jgi:PncC family amidohydrolase